MKNLVTMTRLTLDFKTPHLRNPESVSDVWKNYIVLPLRKGAECSVYCFRHCPLIELFSSGEQSIG